MYYHKFTLTDIENMIPWERTVYIKMLIQTVEEENRQRKEAANRRG